MGLWDASKLLDFSQLSLAGMVGVVIGYFLIPTFVVLSIVGVMRRQYLNRRLNKNNGKLSRKQQKINKVFSSTNTLSERLGNINEPVDKSKFETLELEFNSKGKVIKKGRIRK